MPPSPGACKVIARLDRADLPRYSDGRVWLPPGGEAMSDTELIKALAAAWGTPSWVLGMVGNVVCELGLASDKRWIGHDPAWRPGTAVDTFLAAGAHAEDKNGLGPAPWGSGLPWWLNCPWSDGKTWARRAVAEHRAGRPGAYLAPVSNGAWHALLAGEAAAALDISPLAFEPCPGLSDFKVTNCPYGVRIYILPGSARPRVKPRVFAGANPSGAGCALWAGPRAY